MKKLAYVFAVFIVTQVGHASDKVYSWTDIAKHSKAKDCWMVIEGTVYDVTSYLPKHPETKTKNMVVSLCGKDATEGWMEKGEQAEAHSKKAERLLSKFKIGLLSSKDKIH